MLRLEVNCIRMVFEDIGMVSQGEGPLLLYHIGSMRIMMLL